MDDRELLIVEIHTRHLLEEFRRKLNLGFVLLLTMESLPGNAVDHGSRCLSAVGFRLACAPCRAEVLGPSLCALCSERMPFRSRAMRACRSPSFASVSH